MIVFCSLKNVVYYESLKWELKTKTTYGYRCDERLKTNVKESTRLACTPLCVKCEVLICSSLDVPTPDLLGPTQQWTCNSFAYDPFRDHFKTCQTKSTTVCETIFQGELSNSCWGTYWWRHRVEVAGGPPVQPKFFSRFLSSDQFS